MTTVQIAVPMVRGRRRFRVERGRRWSLIEHLMLRAVAEDPTSAADLERRSGLPRRVIVEAFIRLMRVGWVQVVETDEGALFSATPSGSQQVKTGELTAPTAIIGRWMAFTVDQVTGSVFRGSRGFNVRSTKGLVRSPNSEALVYLDKHPRHDEPDLSAVFEALAGEDEVIVGVEPSPEKLYSGFAVFTVTNGIITSPLVPLNEFLRAAILLKAAEATPGIENQSSGIARIPAVPSRESEPKLLDHNDLVMGGDAHRSTFEGLINRAKSHVIIHSTFISEEGWAKALPLMYGAVARGAQIHIFWGQSDDKNETSTSRRAVAALRDRLRSDGRADKFQVHPFTTGSHAKMIVADDGRQNYQCVLGSCNWLSTDFVSFETSVRLRDPSTVGEALRILASLTTASDGMWNATASMLTALGRSLGTRSRPPGRTGAVKLLMGPDHAAIPLEARDEAKARIFVTSHRIGIAGKPMILIPAVAAASKDPATRPDCRVYYGRPTGPLSGLDTAELVRQFAKDGVNIRPIYQPRLHAKVLGWDDDNLIVTSQNWLSADPSESSFARELGVRLKLNKIASTFISTFENSLSH